MPAHCYALFHLCHHRHAGKPYTVHYIPGTVSWVFKGVFSECHVLNNLPMLEDSGGNLQMIFRDCIVVDPSVLLVCIVHILTHFLKALYSEILETTLLFCYLADSFEINEALLDFIQHTESQFMLLYDANTVNTHEL